IYSFDDEHVNQLALVAPVSRIMVRQVQSSSNAGTFTNGMPMTSSMGCGVWGGNITNENIALKHYMNVTWVSRPIAEDRPSEQVAAHAADGYARATGKPGVLLTHLGPGLTNAATGVANAALDSIPMVVIAGDVQSYFHGRHPHQEVNLHQDADQYQIYRPFCKRVYRVENARDLPRIIERAFHLSQTGRPGPVLVDVPMDVFSSSLPIDA